MPAIDLCHARLRRPLGQPPRGFSIAELVSAIVVLAVGMLGVVALYVDRIHEQTHNPRSIATNLAEAMADRIRSRGSAGAATHLQVAPFCTELPGAEKSVAEQSLAADTLAQDVACWQDTVGQALPNGTGMVEHEGAGYRVTVSWSEAGVGAASVVLTSED